MGITSKVESQRAVIDSQSTHLVAILTLHNWIDCRGAFSTFLC